MSEKKASVAVKQKKSFAELYSKYGTFTILVLVMIIGTIASPKFLTLDNMSNVMDLIKKLLFNRLRTYNSAAIRRFCHDKFVIGDLSYGEPQFVHAGNSTPVVLIITAGALSAALQEMPDHNSARKIIPIVSGPAKFVHHGSQEKCRVR